MGSRKNLCKCYLDHSDIDEMCEPCRDKVLNSMTGHFEPVQRKRKLITISELLLEMGIDA